MNKTDLRQIQKTLENSRRALVVSTKEYRDFGRDSFYSCSECGREDGHTDGCLVGNTLKAIEISLNNVHNELSLLGKQK